MKPIPLALGLLLVASICMNIQQYSRLRKSATAGPVFQNGTAVTDIRKLKDEVTELKAQLVTERSASEEWKKRAEDKGKAVATPLSGEMAKGAPRRTTAELKEKIRKLMKLEKMDRGKDGPPDPEAMKEAMGLFAEFMGAMQSPSSEPVKYVEFIASAFEVNFEDAGTPLSEEQVKAVAKLSEEVLATLKAVPQSPAVERQIGDLEGQSGFYKSLIDLLTPEQRKSEYSRMIQGLDMGTSRYVSKSELLKTVMEDWSGLLKLDPGMAGAAESAAQTFVASMKRIQDEFKSKYGTVPMRGDVKDPYNAVRCLEMQAQILRAQAEAIKGLQGSLTDAQKEFLAKKPLWGYVVWDMGNEEMLAPAATND